MLNNMRILISRTDSIGDVMLTLPMLGLIKKHYPNSFIGFLGKSYTQPIINACTHVDIFIDWDILKTEDIDNSIKHVQQYEFDTVIHVFPNKEVAAFLKKSGIKNRIGTTNRLYHWWTCNKLIKLSRKNSDFHEAELNLRLLSKLGINEYPSKNELSDFYGFENIETIDNKYLSLLDSNKKNIILHPKSKGSAREWGVENFQLLIESLDKEKFKIFISGTKAEGELIKDNLLKNNTDIIDITGLMNLSQFISFIAKCDALIACSTGPLHIAAALGINTIGIYPPIRPMHPGRWAPIGKKSHEMVKNTDCSDCRKTKDCHCIREIEPQTIKEYLNSI